MLTLNGKPIRLDQDLVVGEGDAAITYPAASLLNASLREELGIVDAPDPVRPDDRFFFVSQNDDGTFEAIPRDLDAIKAMLVAQVKATAAGLLAPSDWKVIREIEGGVACDDLTKAYRAAVRQASNDNEAAILSKKKVETLASFAPVWPEVPA